MTTTTGTSLIATASCLPAKDLPGAVLSNREWAELTRVAQERRTGPGAADCDASFPEQRIGVLARRVLDKRLGASDLAIAAARRCVANAEIDVDTIDVVLVTTVTPEMAVPAVACRVQADLGLRDDVAAYDLHLGCNGFMGALDVASSLLASRSRGRCALVVAAETMTRVVDAADRQTGPIFGDGAGAVLLRRTRNSALAPVRTFTLGAHGDHIRIAPETDAVPVQRFVCSDGKVSIETDTQSRHRVFMNGRRVYRDMSKLLPSLVSSHVASLGLALEDIDRFAFHQANRRMIEGIVRSPDLSIPEERLLWNIEDIGNTGSASIPILLDQCAQRGSLETGQRVLLVGFGTGYSLGMTLVNWIGDPSNDSESSGRLAAVGRDRQSLGSR